MALQAYRRFPKCNNRKQGGVHLKGKLVVERDHQIERMTGLLVDTCTAFVNGEGSLRVYGEVCTANSAPLSAYREIQFVVLDADGDIIHRDYTNWASFGLRQSFEMEVETSDLPSVPVKVKVYPSSGGYS